MKKILALVLCLAAVLMLMIPLLVVAEGLPDPAATPVVELEPVDPVSENPVDQPGEPDPGGLDFTPIFQALLTLMASWITLRVIPWIKARTSEKQYELLANLVGVGVLAAENLYKAGQGAEKFAYVVSFLKRKGINVDEAEIEATVYELFNQFKCE